MSAHAATSIPGSFWREDKYHIHFYCALCGGPFARVYRTPSTPEFQSEADEWDSAEIVAENGGYHTIPDGPNLTLSPDELAANADPVRQLEAEMRYLDVGAAQSSGTASRPARHTARVAYDGSKIPERDMQWTRVLRALIHRDAQVHPEGGAAHLGENNDVYLTGRGRVRENASWADAYPSIQDELEIDAEEDQEVPTFSTTNFGFHMYQEPDRTDRKLRFSSIPFHEECWDILQQAAHFAWARRGLSGSIPEPLPDLDLVWSQLCGMMPIAVTGKLSDLTTESLSYGTATETITRLDTSCMGNGGYGQANFCSEGKRWLHCENLEWLGANPTEIPLPFNPFQPPADAAVTIQSSTWPTRALHRVITDPFLRLPDEVLVEIFSYLSCAECYRWRAASVPLNLVAIPRPQYHRFLKEELIFLPKFIRQVEDFDTSSPARSVDWRRIFERVSIAWRNDSRLRNRRRIWKIVEPMAEEMVERSKQNILQVGGLNTRTRLDIAVVRGGVGVRSGADGFHDTVLFAGVFKSSESTSSKTSSDAGSASTPPPPATPDSIFLTVNGSPTLESILVWSDDLVHSVSGLEFIFVLDHLDMRNRRLVRRRLGSRGTVCNTFTLAQDSLVLTGLNVCWFDGLVRGIQLVFEESSRPPTETCINEKTSPRYGSWMGPVRRLVAPRSYRHLAGVSGFINSAGGIETLALVEESIPVRESMDEIMVPPKAVPLSHQESSVWAELPPRDVHILEREGPAIGDWRIREAACEVFAKTSDHDPPGTLQELLAYAREDYITGLQFRYRTVNGRMESRSLGFCGGRSSSSLRLEEDEEIVAAMIAHDGSGIRSIQVSTSQKAGPACGARYLGTRTIFVQGHVVARQKERLGDLVFLRAPILGFHCVYNSKRMIQLGLICAPGPPLSGYSSSVTQSINGSPGLYSPADSITHIPFVDIDEYKHPWVDGAPPSRMIYGRKEGNPLKTLRTNTAATFAGWINFRDPISQIIIYGKMVGIKVSYRKKGRPDSHFGDTHGLISSRSSVSSRGLTCIASYVVEGDSISEGDADSLPLIKILTKKQFLASSMALEAESEALAGLKLSFTSTRIVDWHPLLDLTLIGKEVADDERRSFVYDDRWKSPSVARAWPSAHITADLANKHCILSVFTEDVEGMPRVDAVKGYVRGHRFCGLRFRRGGFWDEECLGQPAPDERLFVLGPSESFCSLIVSEGAYFGGGNPLALCTDAGRTSPWFGLSYNKTSIAKSAPPSRRMVGLYMAYSSPDFCDDIGIIHDEEIQGRKEPRELPRPKTGPVTQCEISARDTETDLDWATDPKTLPANFHVQIDSRAHEGIVPLPQRAHLLFDPRSLKKIEAYMNTVPGRYGLKGLRFHGDRTMGISLLGDWQVSIARPTPRQTIFIQSSEGERINKVNVAIHQHPNGSRIIGLRISTNMGQEQEIADWAAFTNESPPMDQITYKEMVVRRNETLVGLHYLLGLYVHTIDLITIPKDPPPERR